MSKSGCPYENAPMERYFNTLKTELLHVFDYETESSLYSAIIGFLGFLAGCLSGVLRRSRIGAALYSMFAGVLFSMIMDIWSALWLDGVLTLHRYLVLCLSALPFTVTYAVSNVVFLLILMKLVGEVLERL